MKILEKIFMVISIIIIIYIVISFFEVNCNNGIQGGDISNYNIFKIFLDLLENKSV